MSILCLDKPGPFLSLKVLQVSLEVLGQFYVVVRLHIAHDLIRTQLLGNPYQLIIIVVPLEERLLKDHP